MKCPCGGTLEPRARPLPEFLRVELEEQLAGPRPRHRKKRTLKKLLRRWEEGRKAARARMAAVDHHMATRRLSLGCSKCGRTHGLYSALVQSMFQVQEMPPGAAPIFFSEPP